jgi:hypothetical protein
MALQARDDDFSRLEARPHPHRIRRTETMTGRTVVIDLRPLLHCETSSLLPDDRSFGVSVLAEVVAKWRGTRFEHGGGRRF